MEPRDIALLAADAITDKKGDDILILDVEALVGYAAYFVIASARSERQVSAISDHVVRQLRTTQQVRPLGTEGASRSKWALIDFGDVVVHVFREDQREFYDLEGLWQDAPRVEYQPAVRSA